MPGSDDEDTQDLLPHRSAVPRAEAPIVLDEIPVGTRVGSFLIKERIASGGGGTVYVAEEAAAAPGPPVAIKVLLRELAASPLALQRFQRESEVVGRIHHPNIVRVLDSGALPDGHPYIVMELVGRENLKTMLRRRGRLSPEEMLEIMEPACSALAAAHAAGVIHRDLKASNISIGTEGGRQVIKLLDFGIAKLVQDDGGQPGLTVRGARLGTPHAMAPEQIRGEPVDERADIYSLGVLIYQLVTGDYPFSASSPQEIERLHSEATPPRPSDLAPVSPALDAVILCCLEKDPAARFASVGALMQALRAAVAGDGGRGVATGEEKDAVAILVQLGPGAGGAEDQPEGVAAALDVAEETLRAAGFELPLQTSTAVLAARLAPADAEENRQARQQALAVAHDLLRHLRDSVAADLDVVVSLHAGKALVRAAGHLPRTALQILGGPILRVADWALVADLDGVRATREGAAGLTSR